MKVHKKVKVNPVAPELVARLCDPFFRSMIYVLVFVLAIILSFKTSGYDIRVMARKAMSINTLNMVDSPWMVPVYLVQMALSFISLCIVASRYVASGAKVNYILMETTDLSYHTAVITGGTAGVGREIALQLLKWKCKVIITGRDKTRGANAIEYLRKEANVKFDMIQYVEMDLNDLKSVKTAAQDIMTTNTSIEFFINNAGIAGEVNMNAYKREAMFATNFLGHFYWTKLFMPTLIRDKARIINVSSIAHYYYNPTHDRILQTEKTLSMPKGTPATAYYGRSKLYNIWHTQALQRRLDKLQKDGKGAICVSCAPGIVDTLLLEKYALNSMAYVVSSLLRLFVKSPCDGAQTTLYLCAAPLDELVPGAYYYECQLGYVSRHAQDVEKQEALYNMAEKMVTH